MKSDFPAILTQHLQSRSLTLRAFAAAVGVTSAHIHRVRTGTKPPPLRNIPRWADALGLSAKERHVFYRAAIRATLPEELQQWLDGMRPEK